MKKIKLGTAPLIEIILSSMTLLFSIVICISLLDLNSLFETFKTNQFSNLARTNWTALTFSLAISILSIVLIKTIVSTHNKTSEFIHKMRSSANTDPLTGLPNRRVIEQTINIDVIQAFNDDITVCFAVLDLDHFKQYNDTFGHLAGDNHLKVCSTSWASQMRADDVLLRMGGEEFGIVLFRCTLKQAVEKIQALQLNMPPGTSFSAGVALWERNMPFEVVYELADSAMYEAKAAGRARVHAQQVI